MKVNSTGLGKTTLTAHISGLTPGDEPGILTMKIESTEPVHWFITCAMEPKDIRTAIKMVLKPTALLRIIRMAAGLTRKDVDLEAAVEAEQNG
ncbi:MAG: hypothetical protein V1912_02975 [bacterium]